MNLIGNFLNMMPARFLCSPEDPYTDILKRTAKSAMDVQKYSLAPFLKMVDDLQPHYPVQDPSRNPVYSSMIDMVPNEGEDGEAGLTGVMDQFIFVNTRRGAIWSVDGVYNTLVFERHG